MNAWAQNGWNLGNMNSAGSSDPTYQVMAVEVFGPNVSGSASCTVWDATPAAATCSDGIQNQGETGVDCGGPCSACSGGGGGTLNCGPEVGPSGQAAPSGAVGGLQVLNWSGHSGALSYSFDDSNQTQIDNYATLNSMGVPYTFYMWTGKTEASNAVWAQAAAAGHEIGNHTTTHPSTAPSSATAGSIMDGATSFIQANIGKTPYTFAAPYGHTVYQGAANGRFLVNRGVNDGIIAPNGTTDRFNLPGYIPPTNASTSTFNAKADGARTAGGWQIFTMHGFTGGSDGAYQPFPLSNFTSHVTYAKGLGSATATTQSQRPLWIGTVEDVASYWLGQKTLASVTPTTSLGTTTYNWTLPSNFPPNKCLRVTTTGGTLTQGGQAVPWNSRGYYEISLSAGNLSISGTPPAATCSDGIQNQGETGVDCGGPCSACATSSWTSVGVGSVSPAGSFAQSGSTYTLTGAGADIYGTTDAFHYVYKQVTGDATIIARATSLTNTHQWAKAGVMFRENLNANSMFAMMQMRPDGYVQNQHRLTAGASTGGAAGTVGTAGAPKWLKIQRTGNTFVMSYSSNGTSWTQAASQTISMSSTIYVGLLSCSHANGTLATAVFDNVSVDNPGACAPATACTGGAECGTQSNGCGGTINCGSCGAGEACNTGTNLCECAPATSCSGGAECGTQSDGCGGTLNCGSCGAGETCNTGTNLCDCGPATQCSAGAECGTQPDGCGGTLNCGSCGAGEACNTGTNLCQCAPATACSAGAQCGTQPDGCGGTIDCGSCGAYDTCDTGTNQCQACVPATACSAGAQCGTQADGCGGTIGCGTCTGTDTCNTGTNQCQACVPATSCSGGAECGSQADGCGGTVSCGSCGVGEACNTSTQLCECVPATECSANSECGTEPDGCGGSVFCGSCGTGNVCDGENQCVAAPADQAWLEVECGSSRTGAFSNVLTSVSGYSGTGYVVSSSPGVAATSYDGSSTDKATFTFNLGAGTYTIYFRIDTDANGEWDSWFYRVNGGTWRVNNNHVSSADWHWVEGVGGDVTLGTGNHTIEIANRQQNLKIDKVAVLLASAAAPSGQGSTATNCAAPTCDDGIQNQGETAVDCGGSMCAACPASCSDGIKNQTETDIDCGGSICGVCGLGWDCLVNGDCYSNICSGGVCTAAPSCTDGIKNQDETDVDCGGSTCGDCANGKTCSVNGDCVSNSCGSGLCQSTGCNATNSTALTANTTYSLTPGQCYSFNKSSGNLQVGAWQGGPNYTMNIKDSAGVTKTVSFTSNWNTVTGVANGVGFFSITGTSGSDWRWASW